MTIAIRTFLAIAGLTGLAIGAQLLIDPVGFEARAGLMLPDDPFLLSELRAPGAALMAAGAFIGLGVVRKRFTRPALVVTAVVYSAYGLARLVGFALDGAPTDTLVAITTFELAFGVIAAALSRRSLEPSRQRLEAA